MKNKQIKKMYFLLETWKFSFQMILKKIKSNQIKLKRKKKEEFEEINYFNL